MKPVLMDAWGQITHFIANISLTYKSGAVYTAQYEVTQEQWTRVMGVNPSAFNYPSNPVEKVSWDDTQDFIERLSKMDGKKYRLPTEAEREYAARAGSESAYFFGVAEEQLGQYAWYLNNSGDKTHSVGLKQPNAWGLYDMHGNVWEWCQDWYDENYYSDSSSRTRRGHHPANIASCAAVPGAAVFTRRAWRSGATSSRTTGTLTTGFAS